MEFADRLKMLRKERGISQEQLCADLNLGKSTIFSYEAEGRQPNFKTLVSLAEYFYVSVDFLLGVTDVRDRYTDVERAILSDETGRAFLDYLRSRPDDDKRKLKQFIEYLTKVLD